MDRGDTNTVISNRNAEKSHCPLAGPGQKSRSNEAFRLRFLDLLIVVKMDGKQYGTCNFCNITLSWCCKLQHCSIAIMQRCNLVTDAG